MARIRSIKPSFWIDEKIANLPKSTALFFIALWNFADDQGIVTDSPRSLALAIPIYRPQNIEAMLKTLHKAGLIMRSPSRGLVVVAGWSHQKIDKPRVGKYNVNEIEWLPYSETVNYREHSTNVRRKDRRGEDRKGEDRIVRKPHGSPKPKPDPHGLWAVYRDAFKTRYGVDPTANAKVHGQLSQIAKRLGLDAAEVIKFYISHNDGFYLKSLHSVGVLLSQAESLHVQWQRGKPVTSRDVREFEKASGIAEMINISKNGIICE